MSLGYCDRRFFAIFFFVVVFVFFRFGFFFVRVRVFRFCFVGFFFAVFWFGFVFVRVRVFDWLDFLSHAAPILVSPDETTVSKRKSLHNYKHIYSIVKSGKREYAYIAWLICRQRQRQINRSKGTGQANLLT